FFSIIQFVSFSQNITEIYGKITDEKGFPVEMVNVIITNSGKGTLSDKDGNYKIKAIQNQELNISFYLISFKEKKISINTIDKTKLEINAILIQKDTELEQINVINNNSNEHGLVQLNPKVINSIPNISGNKIQTLLKTLPGVASTNELSSTYSVRGGNFDENLVYINGFEIFKPDLIQTGKQEGLNMINSDLVSNIEFSAGGFGAEYGDKMSSVLDINYKKPTEFKLSADLSLLGADFHTEGSNFNNKLSHLIGARYKNSQYLLNSLETTGQYKPNFFDIQSLFDYKINNKLNVSLLTYYSSNNYIFYPEDQTSSFGTVNEALSLYIDFEGQEKDKFSSLMGGLNFNYSPNNNIKLNFKAAAYNNHEEITFDIKGRYSLNQLDKDMGSSTYGDSILNLGIGSFLNHARNYFDANIYNFAQNGFLQKDNNIIKWELKYQIEQLIDKNKEWKLMDSAGYSIPYNDENLILSESYISDNELNRNRVEAYLQINNEPNFTPNLNSEFGIRINWTDFNNELLISPRFALNYYPKDNKKLLFRLGTGLYYQALFLKELIDNQGNMRTDIRSPRSIHFVASADYDYIMLNRPFHFKAELYYKLLNWLIPYNIENIRVRYLPDITANGYATGLDFRINGEFVEGVESWLSVSFMKSAIDTENDDIGAQPLPNDHTVNISLFFQDYMPGNKNFRMYLALMYLTGTPFGAPNNENYIAPLRMTDYKRVDIGFTSILKSDDKKKKNDIFSSIKLGIEVFNLLGIKNTISYNWVTVVPNSSIAGNQTYSMYAVPNYLSARRLNLRLIIEI
ncbi:MAG: carboxypeptidase-like regulatory domain-containing protein, partial [Bacteroidales bacterium]|nr:carboxypeptidase-like regulatory domain-containing protein [Bacteroidales bacterium]